MSFPSHPRAVFSKVSLYGLTSVDRDTETESCMQRGSWGALRRCTCTRQRREDGAREKRISSAFAIKALAHSTECSGAKVAPQCGLKLRPEDHAWHCLLKAARDGEERMQYRGRQFPGRDVTVSHTSRPATDYPRARGSTEPARLDRSNIWGPVRMLGWSLWLLIWD
jgi:hypothetical protein